MFCQTNRPDKVGYWIFRIIAYNVMQRFTKHTLCFPPLAARTLINVRAPAFSNCRTPSFNPALYGDAQRYKLRVGFIL